MLPQCWFFHIFSIAEVAREDSENYTLILPLFVSRVMNFELFLSCKWLSTPYFLANERSFSTVSYHMADQGTLVSKRLLAFHSLTNKGSLACLEVSSGVPTWIQVWIRNQQERVYAFPQPGSSHLYGFSPVCTLRWDLRCDLLTNLLSQVSQTYGVSPVLIVKTFLHGSWCESLSCASLCIACLSNPGKSIATSLGR